MTSTIPETSTSEPVRPPDPTANATVSMPPTATAPQVAATPPQVAESVDTPARVDPSELGRTPVANLFELIDLTIARALTNWACLWRLLILFIGSAACVLGLFAGVHLWLGVSPWISGAATLGGTGAGSYAAVRRNRRRSERSGQ